MRFPPTPTWVALYILLLVTPSVGDSSLRSSLDAWSHDVSALKKGNKDKVYLEDYSPSFLVRHTGAVQQAVRQEPLGACNCDSCVSGTRSPEEQGVSKATYKCQPAIANESLCTSELNPDCGASDLLYTRFCIVYCRPVLKQIQDQCIQIEDHEIEFTKANDCLGQDPHSLTKVEAEEMTREALEAAAAAKVTVRPPAGSQEALREMRRQRQEAEEAVEKAGQSLERIEKLTG